MKQSRSELINGTANGGFSKDDLIATSEFICFVAAAETPLAKLLGERFVAAGLVPGAEGKGGDPKSIKQQIVDELNRLIGGDPIYTEERFHGLKMSTYTRKLLRKNPTGPALVSLNKALLLDALPKYLRRKPGRGKNLVQKPATVTKSGKTGKYLVLVTLVEPREIEGKTRSGRQKFERQTQAEANDLCVEINAKLFGKELARQLNKHEIEIAKRLLWELLEPEHSDWIEHLDLLVAHCEATGFRVGTEDNTPDILEAAKIYWEEHVRGLEWESLMNYRNIFGFLLPAFGKLKPFQLTDAAVLRLAYGDQPLAFWKTSWKKKQTPEEAEKRRWDTPMQSRSRRPWSHEMKVRFISCVRSFKNWMHSSLDPITREKRNWCPPSEMQTPEPPKIVQGKSGNDETSEEVMDVMCRKQPALTVAQAQALLDISHIVFDGKFAAFYAHGLFGGSRVKETKRMGTNGFDSNDGVQNIATQVDKNDQGRESTLYPNLIVIIEALKEAGLYTNTNLRPNCNQRAVMHVLAGFTTNVKQVIARANRERKRLAKLGIVLPQYNWGIPYPRNALRRTALSMHFKLFGSEALTKEWAGNGDVFRPFYKRLVTKPAARGYWVLLPSHFQRAGVTVNLPVGHKLDSAMTSEVTTAVLAAGEAMKAAMAKLSEAKAKAAAARPTELKARRAVYNKRAVMKRKAKELAALQAQESHGGADTPPLPQAA